MPWSDDTRCLFCDGKLPLYRKLAQGQFCSKAHQESYWKEQEQLAVAVLNRTHDALQAYKPAVAIESILGPEPAKADPLPVARPSEDFVGMPELQGLYRQPGLDGPIRLLTPVIVAADPVEYEISVTPVPPSVSFSVRALEETPRAVEVDAPLADLVSLAELIVRRPAAVALPAFEAITAAGFSVRHPSLSPQVFTDLHVGAAVALPGLAAANGWATPRAQAVDFRVEPVREIAYALAPTGGVLDRLEQDAFPQVDTLCALAGVRAVATSAPVRDLSKMEEFPHAALHLPEGIPAGVFECEPARAERLLGLRPMRGVEPVAAAALGTIEAVDVAAGKPAFDGLRVDLLSTDPQFASLVRLSDEPESRDSQLTLTRPAVMYQAFVPEAATLLPDLPSHGSGPEIRAFAGGVLPLDTRERITPRASLKLRPCMPPEPLTGVVLKPKAKLAPVAPKYSASGLLSGDAMALNGDAHGLHRMAAAAVAFWNHAPRDLRILMFIVPLALGLAFHPSLPKVSVKATQPDTQEVTGQFQQVVDTQWANLRKSIADRAAVGLDENFRQGLDNWMGNSGSVAEWTYDQAGFVQPGRVALYQPSLGLSDYEFQFLGAIDKGALSWVTRAVDFQNYYVVKLVVLRGGPIPQLGIIRYAVIDGKPVDRVDTPVHLSTRTDSLYRIGMEMQGDHYALTIQGQMIDSWTEPRLKRGGVGFFTNRGEQSRIGWVQITHQYDMLGRLFAYLAP